MMWWILGIIAWLIVGSIASRIVYLSGVFANDDWDEKTSLVAVIFWPTFILMLIGCAITLPFKWISKWITHPTRAQRKEMRRKAERDWEYTMRPNGDESGPPPGW